MNPLTILKGAKVFIIAGVVLYGLMMVNQFRKDEQAETDALIQANAAKVSAEARAQTVEVANAQLEAVNRAQAEALVAMAEAQEEIREEFRVIKETQQEQSRVLEGTRLQNAVRGKRELVERLANRATKERFDEIENIFNE